MYLAARRRFLCPLDLDWSMKELGRKILKKVEEKEWMWRDDDRGNAPMLMRNREATPWRNQNQMGFLVPDIVAEGRVTGLQHYEKNVRRMCKSYTYHCDPSAVKLKNNTPLNLTLPKMKMMCHSQCFHRKAMRTGLHLGVPLL